MKNITVSVDEETHRLARIRAAELDTSVSALVREYLRSLAPAQAGGARVESEAEWNRRGRRLKDVIEDIRSTRSGFKAADNLPREELYDRARSRAEAQEAAAVERQERARGQG